MGIRVGDPLGAARDAPLPTLPCESRQKWCGDRLARQRGTGDPVDGPYSLAEDEPEPVLAEPAPIEVAPARVATVAVRRATRAHQHHDRADAAGGATTLRWSFPAGSSEHAQFAAYWFRGALVRWRGPEALRENIERVFADLINQAARGTRGPINVVATIAPRAMSCRVRVCGRLDHVNWPPDIGLDASGIESWAYGTTYWFQAKAHTLR